MNEKITHDLFPGVEPADGAAAADRFRAARRRGTPAWLWPDIEPAAWREALFGLEGAAAALLAGRRPAPLTAASAEAERALCLAAYTSGLGPWLAWHLEAGRLDADSGAARQLAIHLIHGRGRWAALRATLHRTLDVLRGVGMPATIFKGADAALRLFAEPGLRPMADVDLLVAATDMQAAEAALTRAGYVEVPASRMRSPRRSEWRPPNAPVELRSLMYVHRHDPYVVDLHASLDMDFFGVRTVAFGHPAPGHREAAPWLGRNAWVLRQPLLAAQHAVHASHGLHGLTLIRLVELVLLLRRDMRQKGDWVALEELLRSHGAERFAWPALHLAERLAPETVHPRLLARCAEAAPPRLRSVVCGLRPAAAQRLDAHALEERFMWAAGPVEHLRRFGDMLLPGSARGSLAGLGSIYAKRAYQLVRRRVAWRSVR